MELAQTKAKTNQGGGLKAQEETHGLGDAYNRKKTKPWSKPRPHKASKSMRGSAQGDHTNEKKPLPRHGFESPLGVHAKVHMCGVRSPHPSRGCTHGIILCVPRRPCRTLKSTGCAGEDRTNMRPLCAGEVSHAYGQSAQGNRAQEVHLCR